MKNNKSFILVTVLILTSMAILVSQDNRHYGGANHERRQPFDDSGSQ